MAASSVAICNDALIRIGAQPINALSDTTKEGILCNEQYEKARDQLLYAHPWNFAILRTELSSRASMPTGWENNSDWDYSFDLPADCLRILSTDDKEAAWAIESNYLFANYDPVNIKYISQVTNTSLFTKKFEEALALKLAMIIGYSLTQSATLMEEVRKSYELAVAEARSFDAQEMSIQYVEANDFLNSRL